MKHWMYNLDAEKDRMLEEYYETGKFPFDKYPPASTSASQPREHRGPIDLHHDPIKFLLLHLFFFASTVIFWLAGYCAYSMLV